MPPPRLVVVPCGRRGESSHGQTAALVSIAGSHWPRQQAALASRHGTGRPPADPGTAIGIAISGGGPGGRRGHVAGSQPTGRRLVPQRRPVGGTGRRKVVGRTRPHKRLAWRRLRRRGVGLAKRAWHRDPRAQRGRVPARRGRGDLAVGRGGGQGEGLEVVAYRALVSFCGDIPPRPLGIYGRREPRGRGGIGASCTGSRKRTCLPCGLRSGRRHAVCRCRRCVARSAPRDVRRAGADRRRRPPPGGGRALAVRRPKLRRIELHGAGRRRAGRAGARHDVERIERRDGVAQGLGVQPEVFEGLVQLHHLVVQVAPAQAEGRVEADDFAIDCKPIADAFANNCKRPLNRSPCKAGLAFRTERA